MLLGFLLGMAAITKLSGLGLFALSGAVLTAVAARHKAWKVWLAGGVHFENSCRPRAMPASLSASDPLNRYVQETTYFMSISFGISPGRKSFAVRQGRASGESP